MFENLTLENIKSVTPKNSSFNKKYQDKVEEKQPKEKDNIVVFVSMQHYLKPIKVFDMKEYKDIHNLGDDFLVPKEDSFIGKEEEYIDNRYRNTTFYRINDLMEDVRIEYFKITNDLFSLLGVDYEDSSCRREYGEQETRKTFINILRNTLNEYSNYEGKVLTTRLDWLIREHCPIDSNRHNGLFVNKYKFVPNWVEWIRGKNGLTEDKVILPFKAVMDQEFTYMYGNNVRFAQNKEAQTFYSTSSGNAVVSYICEYPMMYSFDSNGNFTNSSAIFELLDTNFVKLLLAKNIAKCIKSNLEIIQLPGNLVSFNLDSLIQELEARIAQRKALARANFFSGYWNPYSGSW